MCCVLRGWPCVRCALSRGISIEPGDECVRDEDERGGQGSEGANSEDVHVNALLYVCTEKPPHQQKPVKGLSVSSSRSRRIAR